MPSIRAGQLKAIIDVSKNIDMYKGKGDTLFSIIDSLEADLNKQDSAANAYHNPGIAFHIYSYIMEHQGYFTHDKEHQNNIMIAYSLLSAFDGELAKNVKQQINADPINQKGLSLYNFYSDPYVPKKKDVLEDGPKQQKMYAIKFINKLNKQPLAEEDRLKIENLRELYKFMTKEGNPLLHVNTNDFLGMRNDIKKLLDYVDTAKGAIDKSLLDEHMSFVRNSTNHYIACKLDKDKAPKTPLGKARLAAAMAVMKNVDVKKADKLYEENSNVTDFKSDLLASVMKKSEAAEKIVDTKPLIQTVKEEKRLPNAEAIIKLKAQLDVLQEQINGSLVFGMEKNTLIARYVVINEIKNQLMTKGDVVFLDNPKVEENVHNLSMNSKFLLTATPFSSGEQVDMKKFCKSLPQEMAKKGAEATELDFVSVNPYKKENADKEKTQDKVHDKSVEKDANNAGAKVVELPMM